MLSKAACSNEHFVSEFSDEAFALTNLLTSSKINPGSYYQSYSLLSTATGNDPANPPKYGGSYKCTLSPTQAYKQFTGCVGYYPLPSTVPDSTTSCSFSSTDNTFYKQLPFVIYQQGPNCSGPQSVQCFLTGASCDGVDVFDTNYSSTPSLGAPIYGPDLLNWTLAEPRGGADVIFRNKWTKAYLSITTVYFDSSTEPTYVLCYTNQWRSAKRFMTYSLDNNIFCLTVLDSDGTQRLYGVIAQNVNASPPGFGSTWYLKKLDKASWNEDDARQLAIVMRQKTDLTNNISGLTLSVSKGFLGPANAGSSLNSPWISSTAYTGPRQGSFPPIPEGTLVNVFSSTLNANGNQNDPAFLFEWVYADQAPPQV